MYMYIILYIHMYMYTTYFVPLCLFVIMFSFLCLSFCMCISWFSVCIAWPDSILVFTLQTHSFPIFWMKFSQHVMRY